MINVTRVCLSCKTTDGHRMVNITLCKSRPDKISLCSLMGLFINAIMRGKINGIGWGFYLLVYDMTIVSGLD